jgi:hypothetical protein
MGATLPLLANHAVTRDDQIGSARRPALCREHDRRDRGHACAAFVLLPALGLRRRSTSAPP